MTGDRSATASAKVVGGAALVVSGVQYVVAEDRTQASLPMTKGRAGTMTHDYQRNGTTTLFAALDVLTGRVIGQCLPRHRHEEFLAFLKTIDREVPGGLQIHLILDNYSTHSTRPSNAGSSVTSASTCTSPRPPPPGSTRSNTGSAISPRRTFAAGSSPASPTSSPASRPISLSTTRTPSRTCGLPLQNPSSPRSNAHAQPLTE